MNRMHWSHYLCVRLYFVKCNYCIFMYSSVRCCERHRQISNKILKYVIIPVVVCNSHCSLSWAFRFLRSEFSIWTKCLTLQPIDDKVLWQKVLYRKIGDSKTSGMSQLSQARVIERIISMAKVMHGLHMVSHYVVVHVPMFVFVCNADIGCFLFLFFLTWKNNERVHYDQCLSWKKL